jgi:hypothetical protein
MPILFDLPKASYFSGTHFGVHSLLDFESRGPGFFHYRHVERAIDQGRTKAFDMGDATHLLILQGEAAYADGVVIKPETYTTSEADTALRDHLKSIGEDRHRAAVEAWTAECKVLKANGAPKDALPAKPLKAAFMPRPEDYSVATEKPWTRSAGVCKAWEDKHAASSIITQADDACVRAMMASVRSNSDCMRYLGAGMSEVTIRGEEQRLPLQIRIDWIAGKGPDPFAWDALCDLKTCDNLNDFKRDIFKYRYDRQAAFYQWMTAQEVGVELPFKLIAVEKCPPHRCAVFHLLPPVLERAYRRNEWLVEQVAEHYAANVWPRGNPEGEQDVDLPHYLQEPEPEVAA